MGKKRLLQPGHWPDLALCHSLLSVLDNQAFSNRRSFWLVFLCLLHAALSSVSRGVLLFSGVKEILGFTPIAKQISDKLPSVMFRVAFADESIGMQQEIFGVVPEHWRLYRRYREIAVKHPNVHAVCSYVLVALTGYLFRHTLQFLQLGVWSGRIAWTMLLARIKAGRLAGKRLDR